MILSFTSIPPRFKYLGRIVRQLEQQSIKPQAVELYLPKTYRRFPGERPSLPNLPDWIKILDLEDDLGPATKILPALAAHKNQKADILYFDDDQNYDCEWLARFVAARQHRPQDAICESGLNIADLPGLARPHSPMPGPRAKKSRDQGKNGLYRLKRALSFGFKKPLRHAYSASGYIDIAEGNRGVCIPPVHLPEQAWSIPDILWTVDDVWLSGMLEYAGTKIWLNHLGYAPDSLREASETEPLFTHIEKGYGRMDANIYCIRYLQEHFKIWIEPE